jgi:hypothetical protein
MSIGALQRERIVEAPSALREAGAPGARPASAPPESKAQAPHAGASAFAAVLQGLGRELQNGESLMRTALGAGSTGRELGTTDLIVLQAGVYRYGEVVDLASRLVDRATSSVKTVLEGQ